MDVAVGIDHLITSCCHFDMFDMYHPAVGQLAGFQRANGLQKWGLAMPRQCDSSTWYLMAVRMPDHLQIHPSVYHIHQ